MRRLTRWSQIVRADGYYRNQKPNADNIMAVELCVSDSNKPLLLANRDFLPYVVDALLLDADHPRAGMKPELKSWCQQHHAECLAQLAMFAPARETLRANPSVIAGLEAVAEGGLTAEARQFAEAALLALSDKELHVAAEGQKHVMLSCEWHWLVASDCTVHALVVDVRWYCNVSQRHGLPWLTNGWLRCFLCRPMGCPGHSKEDQRVVDRSRLRDVV